MFGKTRVTHVCMYCRIHTKQMRCKGGYKCSVCGKILKVYEAVKFPRVAL